MLASDITQCVDLIRRAMNLGEARQAEETFRFHFVCRSQNVDDGRIYWVLDRSSQSVGLIGLHRYLWGPPENVWLAWFAVDPEFQGQGLGKLLLHLALKEARRLGYHALFIETYSSLEFARARAFYQAQGFNELGEIRSYLPDGEDMIVYGKSLIQPYEAIAQGPHRAPARIDRRTCHARA